MAFWKRPDDSAAAHSSALATTNELLVVAQTHLTECTAAFDLEPTAQAEKALQAAQSEVNRLSMHIDRCKRLLDAATAREEAARVASVEAEIAALEAETSHEGARAAVAPLLAKEIELLTKLAELRAQRRELGHTIDNKMRHAVHLRHTIGQDAPFYLPQVTIGQLVAGHVYLREAIDALPPQSPDFNKLTKALLS